MIVPNVTTPADSQSPLTAKPSDTNLLMAAAEMHKLGKFEQPGEAPPPAKVGPKPRRSRRG